MATAQEKEIIDVALINLLHCSTRSMSGVSDE